MYCFVITTLSTSGKNWVLTVFSPILPIQTVNLSEDGAVKTRAYSLLASKYTGDGKVTLVATEASVEVWISCGNKATLA